MSIPAFPWSQNLTQAQVHEDSIQPLGPYSRGLGVRMLKSGDPGSFLTPPYSLAG